MPLAVVDFASLTALVIGVLGAAGLVFTALRFRRDDTTAVVQQQSQITQEMKVLGDEQRAALLTVREERDLLRLEVERLHGQVDALTAQLREWTHD